ncbi:MAG: hypothetical protein AAB908_02030 [Patescibacteria group bacterium]
MAKKKSEFDTLNDKLDRVIDAMVTHDDLKALEQRLEKKIDERFMQVMSSIDSLTKAVADLKREYSVIVIQMRRYDEWFRILSKKTKVKLPI